MKLRDTNVAIINICRKKMCKVYLCFSLISWSSLNNVVSHFGAFLEENDKRKKIDYRSFWKRVRSGDTISHILHSNSHYPQKCKGAFKEVCIDNTWGCRKGEYSRRRWHTCSLRSIAVENARINANLLKKKTDKWWYILRQVNVSACFLTFYCLQRQRGMQRLVLQYGASRQLFILSSPFLPFHPSILHYSLSSRYH